MAFKRLEPEDFIVSSDSVTSTVWSNNSPSLNTYFSSSVQTEGTSGPYYLSVYQTDPDAKEAADAQEGGEEAKVDDPAPVVPVNDKLP